MPRLYISQKKLNFSGGQILGGTSRSLYKRREMVFSKKLERSEKRFQALDQKFNKIQTSLEELQTTIKLKPPIEKKQGHTSLDPKFKFQERSGGESNGDNGRKKYREIYRLN